MAQRIDVPGMGIVEFPDGMTDDQITEAIRKSAPAPVTAEGLAKAGGIGLVKGAIGFAGAPADTNTANKTIGGWIGDKLGIPQGVQEKLGQGYDTAAKYGLAGPLASLGTISPGYQQIKGQVEKATGPLYEPQNRAEKYAQTGGEFVPALLGNKGSLIRGLVTNVAAPAAASEFAGQATEGTKAEPYARLAAALISPLAAERAVATVAPRAATTAISDVRAAANRDYQNPAINAVEFQPGVVDTLATAIVKDLDRSKLNDRIAPKTRAIVEEMANPINGNAHTLEDLRTTRTLLGDLAGQLENGRPTQEARAATQAKKLIDKYIDVAPQSHAASGDIGAARGALQTADANYAAASTAERVGEKLRNAELQAGSTYSGGNLNNATRQKLRPLLTSRKGQRGLTEDELQTIEDTVRGSPTGNTMRALGKFLGGAGGQQMLNVAGMGGGAGALIGGPVGALIGAAAGPTAGFVSRKIGDAMTRANADKIVAQILARSPEGAARATQAKQSDRLAALQRALLGVNAASLPVRSPSQ